MQDTLEIHWGKHHRTYVDNLNKQVAGKPMENKTLEEVSPPCAKPGSLCPRQPDPDLRSIEDLLS